MTKLVLREKISGQLCKNEFFFSMHHRHQRSRFLPCFFSFTIFFPLQIASKSDWMRTLTWQIVPPLDKQVQNQQKSAPAIFWPRPAKTKTFKAERERERRKRKLLWLQVRLKRQIRETKNNLRDQKTKLIFILSTKQLFLKAKLEKKLIFLVKANQLFWNWNKKVYKIPKNVLSGSFVTVLI